ncbi:MAG: sugar transferase [Bacteroidales bacterium]|jgi:lipopolysaccharide/colanic/teichoic acid biosynthesis glycosyltransferase|nr:sugar transferase [Bacteroidales bacterium]
MKRLFDFVFSLLGLIILSPFLIIISLIVGLTSSGGVFYKQERIGRKGRGFVLYKFRSMLFGADKKGLLSYGRGGRDNRVTSIGFFLRKYKLDELPQLLNVIKGDMSFVGPRPEVEKYVSLYSEAQKKVLNVRPGITDPASIYFRNENDVLSYSDNPEQYYIEEIMPKKIEMSLNYINCRTFCSDIKVIFKTIFH